MCSRSDYSKSRMKKEYCGREKRRFPGPEADRNPGTDPSVFFSAAVCFPFRDRFPAGNASVPKRPRGGFTWERSFWFHDARTQIAHPLVWLPVCRNRQSGTFCAVPAVEANKTRDETGTLAFAHCIRLTGQVEEDYPLICCEKRPLSEQNATFRPQKRRKRGRTETWNCHTPHPSDRTNRRGNHPEYVAKFDHFLSILQHFSRESGGRAAELKSGAST